jgi:OmpR family response regulator RpaB
MHRILLIDDDAQLGPPLAAYLARFDLALDCALSPSSGLARLDQGGVDAVILDVMLPEMDGFALCRAIRRDSDIPILMLTARGEVMDRVVGLELGADDYLPTPVARTDSSGRLLFDGLLIDPATRSVQRLGQPVALTSTEFDLLHLLARDAGRVFHRDDILNQLRGHEADLYSRAVDILISRLRKKLEPLEAIKTLRHAGYALALARLPA